MPHKMILPQTYSSNGRHKLCVIESAFMVSVAEPVCPYFFGEGSRILAQYLAISMKDRPWFNDFSICIIRKIIEWKTMDICDMLGKTDICRTEIWVW